MSSGNNTYLVNLLGELLFHYMMAMDGIPPKVGHPGRPFDGYGMPTTRGFELTFLFVL